MDMPKSSQGASGLSSSNSSKLGASAQRYSHLLTDAAYDEVSESAKKEIEFRNKAIRNMWIIIGTICLVVTYNTLYSFILLIWSGESCYVLEGQEYVWVHSLNTIMARSCQYICWLYPLLWLFWPAELSCRKASKID